MKAEIRQAVAQEKATRAPLPPVVERSPRDHARPARYPRHYLRLDTLHGRSDVLPLRLLPLLLAMVHLRPMRRPSLSQLRLLILDAFLRASQGVLTREDRLLAGENGRLAREDLLFSRGDMLVAQS